MVVNEHAVASYGSAEFNTVLYIVFCILLSDIVSENNVIY